MTHARIDWPTLLGDIAYLLGEPHPLNPLVQVPVGTPALAKHLGVSRGTLRNMTDYGCEPRHGEGVRLLAIWAQMSGKPATDAPLARPSMSSWAARRMA